LTEEGRVGLNPPSQGGGGGVRWDRDHTKFQAREMYIKKEKEGGLRRSERPIRKGRGRADARGREAINEYKYERKIDE